MIKTLACCSLLIVTLACRAPAPPEEVTAGTTSSDATAVWMDVDVAVMRGGHEPDDGLALVQAFHSPELAVRGVSSVFGNAPLEQGFPLAQEIVARYGPEGLEVFSGAAGRDERGEETDASRALAEALRNERLIILALGPVTNVATVLGNHPELAGQVEAIVAVAGRRPGQTFTLGDGGIPLMDFNFELDPEAFQMLLDTRVPIVLAPFEISAKVPLYQEEDIERFRGTAFGDYFFDPIQDYVEWYDEHFHVRAIYPYDTLAVGFVISPEGMSCDDLPVAIQQQEDDVQTGRDKPYLLASSELSSTRRVLYCHTAGEAFKEDLMRRLLAE